MKRTLADMSVVITGASSGIGEALARQLHRRGARLFLAARRVDRLESLQRELGSRTDILRCDVAVEGECQQLIESAYAKLGRIDTLVCNAGSGLVRDAARTDRAAFRQIMEVNVFGTSDCVRAAVPRIREQPLRDGVRGQVMIVSSAAARRGLPYLGAYSATKSAQLQYAEALRVELVDQQIAVTTVHPIGTRSEFLSRAEATSGEKIDVPGRRGGLEQTSERVAEIMTRAIARPRRECWPYLPAWWGTSLLTAFPAWADWMMLRMRRRIDSERVGGSS